MVKRKAAVIAEEMHKVWSDFDKHKKKALVRVIELGEELKGYDLDSETLELVNKLIASAKEYQKLGG